MTGLGQPKPTISNLDHRRKKYKHYQHLLAHTCLVRSVFNLADRRRITVWTATPQVNTQQKNWALYPE
jgi:hypothetical protein